MPLTSPTDPSRRSLLAASATALGAALLPTTAARAAQPSPTRTHRVLHLTDMHFGDERNAAKGMETALGLAVARSPDLIFQGGDTMTGTMAKTRDAARRHMTPVAKLLDATNAKVPVLSSAGNHDIWGWNRPRSNATGGEPDYGKKWFIDTLGQGKLYTRRTLGNWHLFSLDSVHPLDNHYRGDLDPEQLAWLESELAAIPKTEHVLILTHIPIFSAATALYDGLIGPDDSREQGMLVPRPSAFANPWPLINLFAKHANVRLCLSGHVHMNERVEFQNTTYICGGAVSGAWWHPPERDAANRARRELAATTLPNRPPHSPPTAPRPFRSPPGFGDITLSPDGSFTYAYTPFPWTYTD